MTTNTPLAIGIDLGATKIAAALVTRRGEIITEQREPTTPAAGPQAVLDTLAALVEQVLSTAPAPVLGIGIGCPGRIDPDSGVVYQAVNLGWQEVALVAEVSRRLKRDVPIVVNQDANAEVLGEAYFGAGQGCDHLVYLGLGSGLGGGAIANGQLVMGHNFTASEIGHLSLDPQGHPCLCGLSGCAETVVSGPGVLRLTRRYLRENRYKTALADPAILSVNDVVQAAHAGDPLALAVFEKVGRWLGMVIAIYAIVINPARVVIGGGVGRAAFDLLQPVAQAELQRRALGLSHQKLEIVPSQLASSALGAACLVWHRQQRLGQDG